jgi:hypothetical protein
MLRGAFSHYLHGALKSLHRVGMEFYFILLDSHTFGAHVSKTTARPGTSEYIREILADSAQDTKTHFQKERKFYSSLGEFIALFASVESILLRVVHEYGKMSWSTARATLSPLRVDQGITVLRRLVKARKLKSLKSKELLNILDQLNNINKLRNQILHQGFTSLNSNAPDDFEVTNKQSAYAQDAIFRLRVSTSILEDMIWDLADMNVRLVTHLSDLPKGYHRAIAAAFRRSNPLRKPPTWRYKSPAPVKNRRKRSAQAPGRANQRKP